MRRLDFAFTILAGAVSAWAVSSQSPVGTWQTAILGSDRGVAYLTFDATNGVSGYGISRDSLAPFTIGGTWDYDANNDVVTGFTLFKTNGSVAVSARMNIRGNDKLSGKGHSTAGHLIFVGAPDRNVADLTGDWIGQVELRNIKMLEMFTVTASTNMPAWFYFTGTGLSNGGTFNVTGSIVITSNGRAAAYTLADFGNMTQTAAFFGKVARAGRKLVFNGRTDTHSSIVFRAERQAQ